MKTFRALTTSVAVEIDSDAPLPELVHALIRAYPITTEPPELRYHLRATEVLRNEEPLAVDHPYDLVPMLEMDLYEQVVARAAPGWLLHAAAIAIDGSALVLCGPSGAGKTTLTLALTSRGYKLLSEEVVWIDRAGTVRGLPRPIHVPGESPQRDRIQKTWSRTPYPIVGRDGVARENILVLPPSDVLELEPLPLRALVRIGHGPEWPAKLQRSAHHVALERLWSRSLRQDDGGLEAATDILRTHGCYELWSTSESEALRLLQPLLN